MKRILALVFMCGAGSCIATDAAPVKHVVPLTAAQKKANAARAARVAAALYASMAPADEYFGPLKLSIIGIQNTIRDIGLRYKYNNDLAAPSFASTQLVESAIRDWAHRYAHDPQLPRNVYFLQRLYTQILLQKSRDRAAVVAQWMAVTFPKSPQARQLKKTLATEHLAPIPTPSPTPLPTDTPTASPEPSPSPESSATGDSPQPGASETARPQERKDDAVRPSPIETGSRAPATAAASAAPTAEPIPIASPQSPAPTAAPSPAPSPAPQPTAGASPAPAPTR